MVRDKLNYRILFDKNKAIRMTTPLDILSCYSEEGNEFLNRIVIGDKTWIYRNTSENK